MDRETLLKGRAYYEIVHTSAHGDLGVFFLSARDLNTFLEQAGEAIDTLSDAQFAAILFPLICRPATHFVERKFKSQEPIFSRDDIARLSKGELDCIAAIFLDHHREFYCKQEFITERSPVGGINIRGEDKEIEHPMLEGETKLAYLHRTFVLYVKEHTKKLAESMRNFSRQANLKIAEVFSQGARLSDLIESSARAAAAMLHIPKMTDIASVRIPTELPEIPEFDSPFVAIGNRMDFLSSQISELVAISSSSGKMLLKMSDMGVQLSNELKESSDTTIRLAKINIRLGWCVLFVAFATLAWSLYISMSASREQTRLMQENKAVMQEMVKVLKSIDQKSGVFLEQRAEFTL